MGQNEQVQELFARALELPAEARPAFLDRACGGEAALRAEVESLLQAHSSAGRFLSSPTGAEPGAVTSEFPSAEGEAATRLANTSPLREAAGTRIGPYKLLQLIGEGGFGSVFMAEQEEPVRRKVALKIIKLGMDTRQVVARFEQERQALAMMDHPSIAKVLDAGATETGRPYFVMELCKGDPIVEYCDKHNLTIADRLELFAQVCQAVQHAHTKGIIHRDLKPSNILVWSQDGRPAAKVIDFGIAKATASKLTEKTLFTEHRALIGTPEYMSPEQAEGSLDIDTRTDVYSLGVLLYELLTGTTPFSGKQLRSAAYAEIQRIIREEEPPVPSTRLSRSTDTIAGIAARRDIEPRKLGSLIRGELDWIVMKALEKDRQRRYETANGLALDIRRFLGGEAVAAAPPSTAYRARKFIVRNRGMVSAAGAVAAALLIGILAFAWQTRVAQRQRDVATLERNRAIVAEGESTRRAEELEKVAAFQSKMLRDIDTTAAGDRLMADIRNRFAAALEKASVDADVRAERLGTFGRELAMVNATDAATELIDQTILKPAIRAVDAQFKDQPTVDASLRHTLAEVHQLLGKIDDALALQRRALEIRRQSLGDDHPETITSMNNLGSILEASGSAAEAEPLYREALERRRRLLGEDHEDTLSTMGNLGNLLRAGGKAAEAEPLLKGSMEGLRRVKGPESRDTLIAMNTYGYLLVDEGKHAEALPYWREAYETGRRVFGPDDRDVLVWTNNLGGLLGVLGRHKEAEPFYREAMEGARRVHGLQHPATMSCVLSYGIVLSNIGRLEEAEAYVREVVDTRTRTLGPDHPDTLFCLTTLGTVLRDRLKFDESEACLRRALETRARVLGKKHPSTLVTYGHLGRLFSDRGELTKAEATYREALELCQGVWSEDHPSRLVFVSLLCSSLISQGRIDEAEPLLTACLDARLRVSGPDHPETLILQSSKVQVMADRGELEEAERLSRDTVARLQRVHGADHVNTLTAMTTLGSVLRQRGAFAEAEQIFRDAAERLNARLGNDSRRTAVARLGLGKTLTALARFQEAEQQLLEAARVLAPRIAAASARDARLALATLYETWEKAEPGRGHGEKAAAWRDGTADGR
jgi:serine/threonine protein kinase